MVISLCITLIIFPRVKPYLEDIIDNEYVLRYWSWIAIFYSSNFFSFND